MFIFLLSSVKNEQPGFVDVIQEVFTKKTAHVGLQGEEIGGNYQGDMVLSKSQLKDMESENKNGILGERYRWPKNIFGKVLVPYVFNGNHSKWC